MAPEKKKRVREVYPTAEVIRHWLRQSRGHARNRQGNVFFSGATLYSYGYHFPLVRHIGDGEHKAVLINGRATTTTTRHRSLVRRVLSYDRSLAVFEVENVQGDHEETYSYLRWCVEDQKERVLRARSEWRGHHVRLTNAVNRANQYAQMFLPGKVPILDASHLVDYATLEAKHNENYQRNLKKKLARFRAGYPNIFIPGYVYLRLRPLRPGELHPWVETTRGFGFPSSDFRKLFPILKTPGCTYESLGIPGECLRLGGYSVRRINDDKTLVLSGPYTIQGEEVMRLVELLEKGDEVKKLPKQESRRRFSKVLEAVF